MRGSIHSEENIVMVIVKARKERILGSCYLVNYLVQIFMEVTIRDHGKFWHQGRVLPAVDCRPFFPLIYRVPRDAYRLEYDCIFRSGSWSGSWIRNDWNLTELFTADSVPFPRSLLHIHDILWNPNRSSFGTACNQAFGLFPPTEIPIVILSRVKTGRSRYWRHRNRIDCNRSSRAVQA